MIDYPSPADDNGRSHNGQFAAGNSIGKGNPHHKSVAKLRSALLESVTADDMKAVVGKLVTMAKDGDLAAIRELFDRLLGKPMAAVQVEFGGGCDALTPEESRERLRSIGERLAAKADSVIPKP